jgi:NAD(P)-dependent dehydrogenase (short-subunit alcohol dehydrogenase family)/pimeloyl-ACP methyl ester carboxylesterase
VSESGAATAAAARKVASGAGIELAVRESGDRDGPTIVFIHGYPDTKEMWNAVLAKLPERFHTIAYDVRGAGASSRPRGNAAYDFERLGDDLLAVADICAPGRRVHLVGHDWGGLQGWEFATQRRFDGRLASFTAIAAPSLDQVALSGEELLRGGRVLPWLARLRRSWYVAALLTPGVPTLVWRFGWTRERWRWMLNNVERVATGDDDPRPTLASDGIDGAKLYRRNMPRRALSPRADAIAHVPVQLVIPTGDRFISSDYYEPAERHAPRLRRRIVGSGHWAPRAQPERIARWIEEFVDQVEAGDVPAGAPRPWTRGGGAEQLRDRLALVTGAASGIGEATARALAARRARVLVVDRDADGAARVAESIDGAQSFACDVSDEAAMERLANSVLGEHGVPQIVVNNAGIGIAGAFLDTSFDDWRQIVSINLMGVVHGARLFGRAMVEQGQGGHIVNTASAAAFAPSRLLPAYSTTKAAVLMLSECLRAELEPWGIGVTAVCPGFIATNITRTTRWVGRGEEQQRRLATFATERYERRNFGPDRVALEIVEAIGADRPLAVVTPEAKLMRALSRFAPGAMRRLARIDTTPV